MCWFFVSISRVFSKFVWIVSFVDLLSVLILYVLYVACSPCIYGSGLWLFDFPNVYSIVCESLCACWFCFSVSRLFSKYLWIVAFAGFYIWLCMCSAYLCFLVLYIFSELLTVDKYVLCTCMWSVYVCVVYVACSLLFVDVVFFRVFVYDCVCVLYMISLYIFSEFFYW